MRVFTFYVVQARPRFVERLDSSTLSSVQLKVAIAEFKVSVALIMTSLFMWFQLSL